MTPKTKHPCCRFRVVGKVQGVFFRASTRDEALKLGITGYAVNLPDGGVEVMACGTSEALHSLRNWLHKGPAMARVDVLQESALDCAAPATFTTG
jgi:acylphosphatase